MSDAMHNPDSENRLLALGIGTKRRNDSPTVGFKADIGTQLRNRINPSGTRSQSGPEISDFVDIGQLPRDVGWLLFGVGFAGFVAPGVFGLPFMVGGGMILWPKTTRRLYGLLGDEPPKAMNTGVKQILRFLNDLEKRYPHT